MGKELQNEELEKVSGGTGEVYYHWNVTYIDNVDHTVKSKSGHNYETEAAATAAMQAFVDELTAKGCMIIDNKVDSGNKITGYPFIVY